MAINFNNVKEWYIGNSEVTALSINGVTAWQKNVVEDFLHTPMFVENPGSTSFDIQIKKDSSSAPTLTVEYSTDKTNWSSITTSTTAQNIAVPANGRTYLRCNCNTWGNSSRFNGINFTGNGSVGGNIMSLIYGSSFTGNETSFKSSSDKYTFRDLFNGNTHLVSVKDLKMPCTALNEGCYYYMFRNCTSLTEAPELPATTLVTSCYNLMFNGCTSLNSIKVAFTSWTSSCTANWVTSVASSGTFYCPSTLTQTTGNSYIPSGWTIVTT